MVTPIQGVGIATAGLMVLYGLVVVLSSKGKGKGPGWVKNENGEHEVQTGNDQYTLRKGGKTKRKVKTSRKK